VQHIRVNTPSTPSEVFVGPGVLERAGSLMLAALSAGDQAPPRQAALLVDSGVPQDVVDGLRASLDQAGVRTTSAKFTTSERSKTLEGLEPMLDALLRAKLERHEPVVALGGGILGDMAGFAAASYRRGVPWINCPTTLLSMVDASVGGKTGVNLRGSDAVLKKNMLGAFWQPAAVLVDPRVLASLPARLMRCGLAECVKHGMLSATPGIEDPMLGAWISEHVGDLLAHDEAALSELIARNISVKARVVERDEREESAASDSGRALLNLGHTFGHAIEPMPGLSLPGKLAHPGAESLQHGEAVALGMVAAAACSVELGLAHPSLCEHLEQTLVSIGLPTKVAGLPATPVVVEAMSHDKKVASGKLRLILPIGRGVCRVIVDAPSKAVAAGIDAIRA
jgi:3-dehydroquinate synthase